MSEVFLDFCGRGLDGSRGREITMEVLDVRRS